MANFKRRILPLFMALVMMLTMVPVNAFAVGVEDLGTLVCTKEVVEHTAECYKHTENCYHKHTNVILGQTVVCGYKCTAHDHTAGCDYTDCELHEHSAACGYACGIALDQAHTDGCYTCRLEAGHQHTDCTLSCTMEENHEHSVGKCEFKWDCTVTPHLHNTDKCTCTKEVHLAHNALTCTCDHEHSWGCILGCNHTHGAACCTKELHTHSDTCCDYVNHIHSMDACEYTWTCGNEAGHTHGDDCYACGQELNHAHTDCALECVDTVNHDHEHSAACGYSCGTDEHTAHTADCCIIEEHAHNEKCERKCDMTTETLVCLKPAWALTHEKVCDHHEHSLTAGCYLPGDAVKDAFFKATGVEIETTEELSASLSALLSCKTGCGYKIASYVPFEIEMVLCAKHFCTICHRLNDGFCTCVEITFANIKNDPEKVEIVKVAQGETVDAKKVPGADMVDYHFLGWFDENGNEFDVETVYTADITFTAQYKALTEAEKLENTLNFIKNNFNLGAELGRIVTYLSNGEISKDTVLEYKEETIKAVQLYMLAAQLKGDMTKDQVKAVADLMNQGDEYVVMVAEWLWPENVTLMPTVDEIMNSIDVEKLAGEIKSMIEIKYGITLDENFIENNKALAEQYINAAIAEKLDNMESMSEYYKTVIKDQISKETAKAQQMVDTLIDEIKAEAREIVENATAMLRKVMENRDLGITIGHIIDHAGMDYSKAKANATAFKSALIDALNKIQIADEYKDALVQALNENDDIAADMLEWAWPDYTVLWMNGDEVLETDIVKYLSDAEYDGETPVQNKDAQYTYDFSGWTKTSSSSDEIVYTAQFGKTVNQYTVTWVVNGKTVETDVVDYGTMAEFNGEEPTKAADAQYTYTFAGWDPEVDVVTGDVTYTAQFDTKDVLYTVTWVVNGETVETDKVTYETRPEFNGETPVMEGNAEFTYEFAGWDPEVDVVTGDVTYTALFNGIVNKYTITFVNEDGTLLETQTVEYGKKPVYTGATPFKADTAEYYYDFAGWGEIVAVTGDATYTAQFTATKCTYRVTFKDGDKTLSSVIYEYGADIVAPALPTKNGWDSEWNCEIPATVTGELTVEVVWNYQVFGSHKLMIFVGTGESATDNPLNWKSAGTGKIYNARSYYSYYEEGNYEATGSTIMTEGVDYERYTAKPGKVKIDGVTYGNQTGSDFYVINEIVMVATQAQYHLDCHSSFYHTVTFVDANGDVIDTVVVEHGYAATAPEAPELVGHTFTGWDVDFSEVNKSMTVTAQYEANDYTVTFMDGDEVIKTVTVKYNTGVSVADAPAATSLYKEGHYFMGWDADITCVTEHMTVYAIWEIMTFTVTWEDGYGNVLETDYEVPYGTTPKYNGEDPVAQYDPRWVYTFACFNPSVVPVTENVTYRATYNGEYRMYTVTFLDDKGNEIDSVEVKYEEAVTNAPEAPAKVGYVFSNWSEDLSCVTENMTVTAEYGYEYIASGKLKVNVGTGTSANGSTKGNSLSHWTTIHNVRSCASYYVDGVYAGDSIMDESDYDLKVNVKKATPGNIKRNGVVYTNGEGTSKNYYVVTGHDLVVCRGEYHLDYKAEFYNVYTFMVDGVEYDAITAQEGYEPEMPADPAKAGYEFDGWELENGVYNAKFTKLHKVTFYKPAIAGGGSKVVYVRDGETVDPLTVNDTQYYDFKYWYRYPETHLKGFNFDTPITADTRFDARVVAIKQDFVLDVYVTINGKNVCIGTGEIRNVAWAGEFYGNNNNVVKSKHYSWSNIDLGETFDDITVDGVTYTYGKGSSDNYYTYNAKTLKVGKISGKSDYYFYVVGNFELRHEAKIILGVYKEDGTFSSRRTVKLGDVAHGTVITGEWLRANDHLPQGYDVQDVVINDSSINVEWFTK